jgi:hypothetical protein
MFGEIDGVGVVPLGVGIFSPAITDDEDEWAFFHISIISVSEIKCNRGGAAAQKEWPQMTQMKRGFAQIGFRFWIFPRLGVSAVKNRARKIFARGMKKSLTHNFAVRTFVC